MVKAHTRIWRSILKQGARVGIPIACLLFGLFLGFIAFAHPSDIRLPVTQGMKSLADAATKLTKDASWADWIAAVGTWVIGIGAIWFARESHNQRLIETYFSELERSTSMNRRLTMIQIACAYCSNPKAELDVLLSSEFDINRAVRRSVKTLIADTSTFVLAPAEISALHPKAQVKYASVRNRLEAVRIAAEMFLIAFPDDNNHPRAGLAELMRTDLQPLTDAAAQSGDELGEMVAKQIKKIRWPKTPSALQE